MFYKYIELVTHCITKILLVWLSMAREKVLHIRLSDKEWERLEREATRREVPVAQVFRDFLKTLDRDAEPA